MSTYIIVFQDNEEKAEARGRFMEQHLQFLEKNQQNISAAGPLFEAEDEKPAGGLWIVEAEDLDTVMQFVRADPFWGTGLRQSVRVLQWNQVFKQGRRLIRQK